MWKWLVLAAVSAAAAVALVVVPRHATPHPRKPTLAQLAAHNYRVLSATESRRLVAYARSEYRCLTAHGLDVSPPVASRTRITMRAPGWAALALARRMLACDDQVGPPPPRSSLQARRNLILVYVPKRCLLDPRVTKNG